jgi:hypothetical protein
VTRKADAKTLICAAAIAAASVVSSMAQGSNVYSQNIVGYANVPMASGPHTFANPFDKDGINSATNVLTLPDGTYFAFWTGSAFDNWYFEEIGDPGGPWWADNGYSANKTPPILTPGKGFYVNPGSAFTNVFLGNVVPNPGQTNTATIAAGPQLRGSVLPVGGVISNAAFNLVLPDATYVSQWTGSAFDNWYFEDIGDPGGPWWADNGYSANKIPPTLNIGWSLYINTGAGMTWSQSYTNAP